MKIIKHRKPIPKYRGTCQHCGCEIECEQDETTVVHDQRDGDGRYVKCPECDNTHLWVVKK